MQKANPSCMHCWDMANVNLDHVQTQATSMILQLELLSKVGDMQAKLVTYKQKWTWIDSSHLTCNRRSLLFLTCKHMQSKLKFISPHA